MPLPSHGQGSTVYRGMTFGRSEENIRELFNQWVQRDGNSNLLSAHPVSHWRASVPTGHSGNQLNPLVSVDEHKLAHHLEQERWGYMIEPSGPCALTTALLSWQSYQFPSPCQIIRSKVLSA